MSWGDQGEALPPLGVLAVIQSQNSSPNVKNGLKSGLGVPWGDQGEILAPLDVLAVNLGHQRTQKLKAKFCQVWVLSSKKSRVKNLAASNSLKNGPRVP